jgi:hypothetical protein
LLLIFKVRGTIAVPGAGVEEARLHSWLLLMMLKPGGPPKLGLQAALRASKGEADANARKERARATLAENIMIKEKVSVEKSKSGECEGEMNGRYVE